jgi:hypothetical protein
MKTIKSIIFILLIINTQASFAVPVGNNLELIPAPRNLGINIETATQKLTVNGAVAFTNFISNPIVNNSQPSIYVKDNGLFFKSTLHTNPFRLDLNDISNGNFLNAILTNPTFKGTLSFDPGTKLKPFSVNGAVTADVFNGGIFKGNGSLLTGIVPSALKAPDGSPNPALQVDNEGRIGIGTSTPQDAYIHLKTPQGARIMAQHNDESFWSEFATAGVDNTGATVKKWSMGSLGDARLDSLGGKNKFYIFQYSNKNDAIVNGYRMVIDDNGNTGFGTLNPTQKLEVAGNIKANNFIGNGSGLKNIPITSINTTSGMIENVRVNGAVAASVFNGGIFKGDGSSLTGIVPSALKAPDGSPNPALQVDNAGRIGIGTSTPEDALLHVKAPTASRIIAQYSDETFWSEFATAGVDNTGATVKKWSMGSLGDARLDSLGGNNKFYIYQYTNKNDASVNGYRMVIDDNGNTGFGTLTPTQKLEVAGNIKANNFIGNGSGLKNIPITSINTTSGMIENVRVNGAVAASVFNGGIFKGDGSLLTGIVPSSLKAPDGSPNPALQVDNEGRIGIGTSTPQDAYIHLKTPQGARIIAQHSDESFWSEFATAGVDNTGATIKKWSMGSLGDTRLDSLGGKNKFYIYQYTNKNDASVNGYRMVIDDNGNTGFGTLTPTEKLEVAGNIKATRFIGNGSGLTNISTSGITNLSIDSLVDGKSYSTSVFLGSGAGLLDTGSSYSTALGIDALNKNTGNCNTAIGNSSLFSNTIGRYNSALGAGSLSYNYGGSFNTAVGAFSLRQNTTGYGNNAIGYHSLYENTTGYGNNAIGYHSLYRNTTGYWNTAFGHVSLHRNTTGNWNTAIGNHSLYTNTTGYRNTAIGSTSLYMNTIGNNNIAIGEISLYVNSTGNNNTALGTKSGFNVKGSKNITIGADTLVADANGDNQLNIGNLITGNLPVVINGRVMNGGSLNVNGGARITGLVDVDGSLIVKGKILSPNNPWILVHSENFENQVNGWNLNITSNCGGKKILGGFGVASSSTLSKIFDLTNYPHTHVMVKFNYYSLDSWDNEVGIAKIDGLTAWSTTELFYSNQDRSIIPNCGTGGNSTNATLGKDLVFSGEARLDHTSNSLNISFGSTLNESSINESFGIDNLEIWVKSTSFDTSLPNTPSASNNAFCGPNGYYQVSVDEYTAGGDGVNGARNSGPSTANFEKCSNLLHIEMGHSVTRTWNFVNPPRSGFVNFKIEKRRTGLSTGEGFSYWFPTNTSGLPQPLRVSRANADIIISCLYDKALNTYQCNYNIHNL